jgi:hypothetical protein
MGKGKKLIYMTVPNHRYFALNRELRDMAEFQFSHQVAIIILSKSVNL